jgi:hypothetical protein
VVEEPVRRQAQTFRATLTQVITVGTAAAIHPETPCQVPFVLVQVAMHKGTVNILGVMRDVTDSALSTAFTAQVHGASLQHLKGMIGNKMGRLDFNADFSRADLAFQAPIWPDKDNVLHVNGATITRPRGLAPFVHYDPTSTSYAHFATHTDVKDMVGVLPHHLQCTEEFEVPPGFVPTRVQGNTSLYTGLVPRCANARAAIARLAALPVTETDGPVHMQVQFWFNRHNGYARNPAGSPRRFVFCDAYASISVFPGATTNALVVIVTLRFWPGFGTVKPLWA